MFSLLAVHADSIRHTPGRPDAVWAEANSFFGHDSKHAKMARQEIKNSQMKTPSFHSAAYGEPFIPTGPTAPPPSSLPPQTVTQPSSIFSRAQRSAPHWHLALAALSAAIFVPSETRGKLEAAALHMYSELSKFSSRGAASCC